MEQRWKIFDLHNKAYLNISAYTCEHMNNAEAIQFDVQLGYHLSVTGESLHFY